jgi:hypothetical protein
MIQLTEWDGIGHETYVDMHILYAMIVATHSFIIYNFYYS